MIDFRGDAGGTGEFGVGIAACFLFSRHDFSIHNRWWAAAVGSGIGWHRVTGFLSPLGEGFAGDFDLRRILRFGGQIGELIRIIFNVLEFLLRAGIGKNLPMFFRSLACGMGLPNLFAGWIC